MSIDHEFKKYIDEVADGIDENKQVILYLEHELQTHLKEHGGEFVGKRADFAFPVDLDIEEGTQYYEYVHPMQQFIEQLPEDAKHPVFLVHATWGPDGNVQVMCAVAGDNSAAAT